jgi:hypothetical protein
MRIIAPRAESDSFRYIIPHEADRYYGVRGRLTF